MSEITTRRCNGAELTEAAENIQQSQGAKGVIVLCQDQDGVVTLARVGCNHADANGILSVGIHINLLDHDAYVINGAAGEDARNIAQSLAQEATA